MKENDEDSQLSDLMTSYLQHFKATTGVKLSLIEALCLQDNSLQCNPQFLLSKFSTRSYVKEWKIDPNSITLDIDNSIIAYRFQVSLKQYLEFRLKAISEIGDGVFLEQIESFQKELHHAIKKLQSNDKQITNLAHFFLGLNNAQSHFIWSLFEKIEEKKINRPRAVIDHQYIEEIKKFFRDKVNKQQNEGLTENVSINSRNSFREYKISLPTKTEQVFKPKGWILRKIYHKKETTPMNIILEQLQSRSQKVQQEINPSNLQISDEFVELQAYVAQTQQNKLKSMLAILDVDQNTFNSRGKNELEAELKQRNLKNKIHIETFINKYERKLRKRGQKDQNDRSARSTVKTSKEIPHRRQDMTIFQQKIDNVQYLSPFFKNGSDSFKRGEGILGLPPISNRHNRRITIQK